MSRIKVMTVFGTRPEAIKMAPVVLELQKYPEQIIPIVAVTAQHREMLDQVLQLFQIVPDYDLDIMSKGQTLFDITSRAMQGLNEVMDQENRYCTGAWRHHNYFCRGAGCILSSNSGRTCRSGLKNT